MSCMECLHTHILSHSSTPSHTPMPSVTTITCSTNDTHIRAPTDSLVPNASTNGKLIPTPITQLEVYVITMAMCLLWATELFGLPRGSLTPMFQAFHLRGLTTSFLLRPTHINYISLYDLNHESFIGHRPKYELTTHSSTLMMDDHTHMHTHPCHVMIVHMKCNHAISYYVMLHATFVNSG